MPLCTFFRSVGISTAAFALAILEGSAQPGVWFPEEVCVSTSQFHFILCNLKGTVGHFFCKQIYDNFIRFYKQPQGIPIEAREVLLGRASQGTFNFVMNRYAF